jgi:hypothetical protein
MDRGDSSLQPVILTIAEKGKDLFGGVMKIDNFSNSWSKACLNA